MGIFDKMLDKKTISFSKKEINKEKRALRKELESLTKKQDELHEYAIMSAEKAIESIPKIKSIQYEIGVIMGKVEFIDKYFFIYIED